ncbi:leucine rich repeat domain-containing protein [Phthorimaea operculella]|nr:leucine rich repeat domain-containing protein [Phthorimaea operculella]
MPTKESYNPLNNLPVVVKKALSLHYHALRHYPKHSFVPYFIPSSLSEGTERPLGAINLPLGSNQLTELPREICQMPLQVLLVQDNMLSTLPKEIGKMTSLAELDASNNRLTQVPMTLGDCAGLRALDLSNNQLGLLPLQITYLRLEHLDVSCNCISSLPLELRNMTTLVTLNLDNNPLVSPPTTVCMRGRVHIFKYLENMANKDTLPHRRVEDTRRTAKHSSFLNNTPNHIVSGNATIDCLRHKPRHVVDSGYCTDGVEKRWSNDVSGNATIDCLRHKPRHVVDSGYCTDGVEKRWSNDEELPNIFSSFLNNTPNHIVSGNATIDCLRHKPRHVVDSGYCTDGVEKRWSNDVSGNATIDCLRHKPRHVVDSGYCTDGVEKRWSNDGETSF